MRDDEHRYWAPAPVAPLAAQPAYNSFMYPAPLIAAQPQPQEVQTAWAPHHSTPMGTYEHVPSINVESEPYMASRTHVMPTHWMPSPPASMPDMIVPASPSSEGAHSPSLPDVWTLPPVQSAWSTSVPYGGQSIQSSPESGYQELFYTPPPTNVWNQANSFSSSTIGLLTPGHNQPPTLSMSRNRSVSDPDLCFFGESGATDISGRRSSYSSGHLGHRSTPYPVHSARTSPIASRGVSPIAREVTHSPAVMSDDGGVPIIAKAVVTTDPVSEASARRRTHEARFQCDLCGKWLTTKTNLEGHRKSHLGVKDFQCGVCDKPFTRDWDRKRHERTHSKKAELACNVCGKTSTRKDAFDKHRTCISLHHCLLC